jgi:hypothetical protein
MFIESVFPLKSIAAPDEHNFTSNVEKALNPAPAVVLLLPIYNEYFPELCTVVLTPNWPPAPALP